MPNQNIRLMLPAKLLKTLHALDKTSKQLLDVMDAQIQAIILSDTAKVEELTEQNSILKALYKQHENEFVNELQKSLYLNDQSESIRLTDLKEIYPNEATRINDWKILLSENVKSLQQKHNQIVQLLEFALVRNTGLMHSIYSLLRKDEHYKSDGEKAGISSGMAINQEI